MRTGISTSKRHHLRRTTPLRENQELAKFSSSSVEKMANVQLDRPERPALCSSRIKIEGTSYDHLPEIESADACGKNFESPVEHMTDWVKPGATEKTIS